jgi:very-short-patch-repair endonuclease
MNMNPKNRTGWRAYRSSTIPNYLQRRAFTGNGIGGGNGFSTSLSPGATVTGQPRFYSPLHTPSNWQIPTRRKEIYQWCRFFANYEPKVAAALDFYSQFPVTDFENVVNDPVVKKFYDDLKRELRIVHWLKIIAYEYYCLGDAFVFSDIHCPTCGGTGTIPGTHDRTQNTWQTCNHEGGTFTGLTVLNPDWVEVQTSSLNPDNEIITMIPDQKLREIVSKGQPKEIYDRIPDHLKVEIMKGKPIQLNPLCVTHLAHNRLGYQPYGRSIIMRLFRTLAYKDKLTQAQWIVADRHIVPVRVVKVGNDTFPASQQDVAEVQAQLLATSNDPNLTLVTHHAFDYDWIGASGKVLQLTKEWDNINQELLDGLMINQALLNGEGPNYSSASIGIEAMIQRLESFRSILAEFIEERIYRPIAIMRGFSKPDEEGNPVPNYPKVKWKELKLRDDTQRKNLVMQLADKGKISDQTLLEYLGFDYDVEVSRKRLESVVSQMYGFGGGEGGEGGPPPDGPMGGPPDGPPGGGGGGPGGAPGPGGDAGGPFDGGMTPSGEVPPAGGPQMSRPVASHAAIQEPQHSGPIMRPKISRHPKVSKNKPDEEELLPPPKQNMTGPEQRLWAALQYGMHYGQIKYPIHPFYKPDQTRKFIIDFAIPSLKLGFEVDGMVWHQNDQKKVLDKERDMFLAQRGWVIARWTEKEINGKLKEKVYPELLAEIVKREEALQL